MKKENKTPYFIFNYCSVSGNNTCAFCVRDGIAEGSYFENGDMKSFSCEAKQELWEGIEEIFKKHNITSWKGGRLFRRFAFAASPDTYTLECILPTGEHYEANASAGFPDSFSGFLDEIKALFLNYKQ